MRTVRVSWRVAVAIFIYAVAGTYCVALQCWTNRNCLEGEPFCKEECPAGVSECSASVRIDHLGTEHALGNGFHCTHQPDEPHCSESSCIMRLHGEVATCCYRGELCNSVYGLTSSGGNPPAVNPCALAGCNSCVLLDTGEVRCFCLQGYDGTECLGTGLICTSRLCNNQGCSEPVLEYCDDAIAGVNVDRNLQHCLTSYMKDSDNTLTPHLSSCFFLEDRENKCTPGVCILKAVGDTNYYQCCCTGNNATRISFSHQSSILQQLQLPMSRPSPTTCTAPSLPSL